MQELLARVVAQSSGWIELRFQGRSTKQVAVRNGELEESSSKRIQGIGVRALVDGVFGFASTTDVTEQGVLRTVAAAQAAARTSASAKKHRIKGLAEASMGVGTFPVATTDPLNDHPLEEKLALVMSIDERIRQGAESIVSSMTSYAEIQDEKIIVTSDGARAHLFVSIPEFRVMAVAQKDGDQCFGMKACSAAGGWSDLFGTRSPEELADYAVQMAVEQLTAPHPHGGLATVVLDPGLVGVLSHEAIGHTVEADIVLGGAITADKMNEKVASELVTMVDSGESEHLPHAVGTMAVDDEGVTARKTTLIEDGVLRSYLHNRETATHFGVEPTGNARAFEYSDAPIIRMRNTYIEPGETSFEEMIADVDEGYYMVGLGFGGQADSNAEFMFGVREARRITNGKIGEMVRGATISGNAFDVLNSVDAVGNKFQWDLGAGTCGKGQAAKVDAGGPHLRCRATIGGRQ
ncbi:TldD/PmbA family protein [Candidatus Bipolaricaulota bacterium]